MFTSHARTTTAQVVELRLCWYIFHLPAVFSLWCPDFITLLNVFAELGLCVGNSAIYETHCFNVKVCER